MKNINDYQKITKRVANYISERQNVKAKKETVALLSSILKNFDNGDRKAIDILSGVCSYIFFDIPESSATLSDLSGTLLLGADLAWHFHQSSIKKTDFERWKNLFTKDLQILKKNGKILGGKGLYKDAKIGEEKVLVKYPIRKAD